MTQIMFTLHYNVSMEEQIDDIDFHINIDAVVDTIQPVTDKILKNL